MKNLSKKIGISVLILLCSLPVFSQTNETSRKRYALVIGNQNYGYAKLSSTISDATKISNALQEKEFAVTFKKDLKSTELKETVAAFIKKVNSDVHSVAFVYLAGHGFTCNDKNYFLPVDNNKFHTSEEAMEYGIDIEADLAGKINTLGQIYVIDGSYDDPFKEKGARAIGVKGGLSRAKAGRESTVGFLFSSHPETVVAKKYNSVFASVLSDEIKNSKENLPEFFNTVKSKVSAKTNDGQVPYSSATTLNFSFNGEELTALKKAAAIADSDKTSLESIEMSRRFKAEQEKRNAALSEATDAAILATAEVSAEIMEKRRLQKEEDERRLAEENELAQARSHAAAAQIEALRQEFAESEAVLRDSMKKNASAEERVDYIEGMKHSLYDIRETASKQISDFNRETDALTREKISEIENRPLKKVEMKEGVITEAAQKRRNDEKQSERLQGEAKKDSYKASKDAEVEKDNQKWLPKIKSAYAKLEGSSYTLTSLEEALTVRVADYDGEIGKWKLHVSADLFGHANVFEDYIYLGYTDVTGKKTPDVSKLSDSQLEEYNEDVEIYDALFRRGTPVFYVKLYYKVLKWTSASEYHFVPQKCEIIRLGKKSKVITKIKSNSLNPTEFVQTPAVEIRTQKEIESDSAKSTKIRTGEVKKSDSYKKIIAEEKKNGSLKNARSSYDYDYSAPVSTDDYGSAAQNSSSGDDEFMGRTVLYFSANFGKGDLYEKQCAESECDEPKSMNFDGHITLGLARYYYWGFSAGIGKWDYGNVYDLFEKSGESDLCDSMDENSYSFRFVNGFAAPLGKHLRPYAEAGLAFFTNVYNPFDYNLTLSDYDASLSPGMDKVLGLTIGGGIDVIFTNFMITGGVNYCWMHYVRSFQNGSLSYNSDGSVDFQEGFFNVLKHPDFRMLEFSVGIGFTL